MLQESRHIGSTLRSLVAAGPNGAGDNIADFSP